MSLDDTQRSIETAYRDWGDHLANPNFCRTHDAITWQNREKIWLRDEFDYDTYQLLVKKRQYSFLTSQDGGIIQLFYEYGADGKELKTASASYYGPSRETIVGDSGLIDYGPPEFQNEFSVEEIEASVEQNEGDQIDGNHSDLDNDQALSALVAFMPSIRIDFTPKARRAFVHESCHLHIPGFENARIHVSCFPTPEQFVEMVFAWFYPTIYGARLAAHDNDEEKYRLLRAENQRERWHRWEGVKNPSALPWLNFVHHQI